MVVPNVFDFCVSHGIVDKKPKIAYAGDADADANLRFDPSYMKAVAAKQ